MLVRIWGKRNPIHCWWDVSKYKPLWKTVWCLLKKIKIDLPYDPTILLLGIYPKECYNKGTCTPMLIAALFIVVKPV
jgi:hypothetical protein